MTFTSASSDGHLPLAVQRYNEMCRAAGKQVCLPQPFHVCTEACKLVEIRGMDQYVCAWSRNVHVCGERCQEGVRLKDNSGDVCRLTGRVLPHLVYQHYLVASKVDTRVRKHDHHVKMATGRKRRRKLNSITSSPERLKSTVRKTLLLIMSGPVRNDMYEKARSRYFRDVRARFKSTFQAGQAVCYLTARSILCELRNHYQRSLNRPAEMSVETVDILSERITSYYKKVRNVSGEIADTINGVEIFTACVVSKLATGFSLGSVEIIAKNKFFALHVPSEIQFKDFANIRCRSMSVCMRAIQAACLTKSGDVRIDMQFALN